ncbi:MAG: 16S rRNA (uracil(1498)-N(3))-methyltransferase [Propionibacteriaceae bacterium]|nr:16S rRNA (uracil(1498)-N(3))-methyltransferase [Propionibacteriaceae bacterium]
MSDALFLSDLGENPAVGGTVTVSGDEARHAVAVRRVRMGESVLVADGAGRAVRGVVVAADKAEMVVEVAEVLVAPRRPHRVIAVQALAKGERSDLAVETMTELGVDEIIAWQASRSIVRWQGERGAKSLAKWQSAAREAAKQSRRFTIPPVSAASTREVAARLQEIDCVLVLHEDAQQHLADVDLPATGSIAIVIGPEGGISPEELAAFNASGARQVLISDGVLRTSTAGAVALGQLNVLARRQAQ